MDASKKNSETAPVAPLYISISTSSSDSSDGRDVSALRKELGKRNWSYQAESDHPTIKKAKLEAEKVGFGAPPGFLNSATPRLVAPLSAVMPKTEERAVVPITINRQFSKAGDFYEEDNHKESSSYSGGMDHLRVHPKFLHSNATSHKWALGAFAELLDNALDEVCNGATYVNIDVATNKKDGSKMLLVQDNGGGMTPEKMRLCMSLGYSSKSKTANNIGQYGNGFKTSTMRLGADVIVFSRCPGKDGSQTQSMGILSYTFLRSTKQEDIVVPMVDYEKRGKSWKKLMKSSADDCWNRNLKTIVQWSPYSSEQDLLQQFNFMEEKGTRIIIYNLWEDDEGNEELDFETDPHDIQIRGVNRDEKKIRMAKQYPNSSHFLTYGHSLRSYSAILYQRLPSKFRIILRGKDVKHHCIEKDMMFTEETTYKPKDLYISKNGVPQMVVVDVIIGFVKDAHHHIDIQGFNIYHKNRLIKPFWRVWNASGSGGRGVIGVLEANFVKPAHDKQGFEHTPALARLESRLVVIQKKYWHAHSHEIGYAAQKHTTDTPQKPEFKDKSPPREGSRMKSCKNSDNRSQQPVAADEDKSSHKAVPVCTQRNHQEHGIRAIPLAVCSNAKAVVSETNGCTSATCDADVISKLEEEIQQLRQRLTESVGSTMVCLLDELDHERNKSKVLANQLEEANKKIDDTNEEQEALIVLLSQERVEREELEERLRKKLRDASETMDKLFERIKHLERKDPTCKVEKH